MIFIVVIGGIGPIEGPIFFFALRELLADYGASYLIVLGCVAVLVMMRAPEGLWGALPARSDLRFFPIQRRVRFGDEPARGETVPEPSATAASSRTGPRSSRWRGHA
jgi:branched-chain amino acid transport system permease protein